MGACGTRAANSPIRVANDFDDAVWQLPRGSILFVPKPLYEALEKYLTPLDLPETARVLGIAYIVSNYYVAPLREAYSYLDILRRRPDLKASRALFLAVGGLTEPGEAGKLITVSRAAPLPLFLLAPATEENIECAVSLAAQHGVRLVVLAGCGREEVSVHTRKDAVTFMRMADYLLRFKILDAVAGKLEAKSRRARKKTIAVLESLASNLSASILDHIYRGVGLDGWWEDLVASIPINTFMLAALLDTISIHPPTSGKPYWETAREIVEESISRAAELVSRVIWLLEELNVPGVTVALDKLSREGPVLYYGVPPLTSAEEVKRVMRFNWRSLE